ncbi:envelope-like protein, partial [Trifolium medium]|nr:envelope-like protein [Trifolium medium]
MVRFPRKAETPLERGVEKIVMYSARPPIIREEFLVNIPEDCDNPLSKEYLKVFVRGKCVEFSPTVINKFLERNEDPQPEVEVTDNDVCKEITANQVKVWPKKG